MAFNINGAATAGPKGLFSIDPLDVRLQVKTKAALADIKAGTVYESIHVFCQEDKKFYTPKNYSTTAADANVEWEEVKSNSAWGQISGTLSDQTDLNTELTNIKTDISNLQARGRFLSLWNAVTGLPASNPATDTYEYKTGDYFVVGRVAEVDGLFISQTTGNSLSNLIIDKATYKTKVNPVTNSVFAYTVISEEGEEKTYGWKLNDTVVNLAEYGITYNGTPVANDVITVIYTATVINYRPDGTTYTKGVASTTVETEELSIDDTYYFDGAVWKLQQNRVKIATTSIAGIVKPDGTSITVTEDGTISATTQESNYRGRWVNYASVPTDSSLYPADFHENRKPTNNDFIVISDTSDYITPSELEKQFSVVNLHPTTAFTMVFTDEEGVVHNCYYNEYNNKWVVVSNEYSLWYSAGVPGRWYIKTNNETDLEILVNGVKHKLNPSATGAAAGILLVQTSDSSATIYGGLPPAAGQYQGTWRFAYDGVWDTDGKNGWKPQYQIENTLPIATSETLGIVKPDNTTITVDTDGTITAEATINTNENVENGVIYDWIGTLEEYEALESYDDNKVYFITDDDEDTRHNQLWGRSEKNAHPISAITGLEEALANSTANVNLKEGNGIDIRYPSTLPAGYTQLEYVESTGAQYVDTGVFYASGDNVKIKYQYLEFEPQNINSHVFGVYMQTLGASSTNSHCSLSMSPSSPKDIKVCGCMSGFCTVSNENNIQPHTYEIQVNKPYFDGKEIKNGDVIIFSNPAPYETAVPMGLFGARVNNWPTPDTYDVKTCTTPLRIYEFEIEGKCKFVPAKNNAGVVGFYDIISENFISTEDGTPLIAGPELNSYVISALVKAGDDRLVNIEYDYKMPEGYTRLEYLENNGQQYIDTGTTYACTDIIRAKVYLEPMVMGQQDAGVFGVHYCSGSGMLRFGNGLYAQYIENFRLLSRKSPIISSSGGGGAGEDTTAMMNVGYPFGTYDIESSNNVYYINNEKIQTSRWYYGGDPREWNTTPNTMKLFTFDSQNGSSHGYTFGNGKGIRIYYYKQYDYLNNPKVIMYPARRNSDGVLGFYDFVNNIFHANANTEETESFIAGPETIETSEAPIIIETNLKLGDGLTFVENEYDGITQHKNLSLDTTQVLTLRKNSGAGTIYNANAINTTYPGNESNQYMTVIGGGNTQGNTGSTSYGYNASAAGSYGTSIGYNAKSSSGNTVAVGYMANAAGDSSVAIGNGAKTTVISGTTAKPSSSSVAVGLYATVEGTSGYGIAIGPSSYANTSSGPGAIAIGQAAQSSAPGAIAIGRLTTATGTKAMICGESAGGVAYSSVFGPSANCTGNYGVAIGYQAKTWSQDGVSLGRGSSSGGNEAIAIGSSAKAQSASYSIAIGSNAQVTTSNAIQLGEGTNSTPYTFKVWGYQLLNNNGYVPIERIAVMDGASSANNGSAGVVPAPSAGDQNKYLRGDGTWQTINTATSLTALTDTDINNPQDEHALVYSSAKGKWVNKKAGVQATYDATNFRITFA